MVLYDIPDIRLFWSGDAGFLDQFRQLNPTDTIKYRPLHAINTEYISYLMIKLPKNIKNYFCSFSIQSDIFDVFRMFGDQIIEQVNIFYKILNFV